MSMANQIQGLRPDGTLPSVAHQQVIDLIGENPSVDEGQVRDIVDQRFAELPPVPATEESVIKALGFRMVVSPDPPAEPTYTLSDGTVVRVVWQKPMDVFVPVFPEAPYWDDYEGIVLVPTLVGVEYRLTRVVKGESSREVNVVIPGDDEFSITSAVDEPLPYDVRVEALALPGYALPNEFAWTHTYPDPEQVEVITSDSFNRDDGWLASGDLTDAADGGTPLAYSGTRSLSVDDVPVSSFRVEDGKLVKKTPLEISEAGGVASDSWNTFSLNAGARNVRVAFDLTPPEVFPVPPGDVAWLVVGLAAPSGTSTPGGIVFTFVGGTNQHIAGSHGIGTVHRGLPPAGRYVLERHGSTVRFTAPGETTYSASIDIDDLTSTYGTWVGFRDSFIRVNESRPTVNSLTYSIDNLEITKLGF